MQNLHSLIAFSGVGFQARLLCFSCTNIATNVMSIICSQNIPGGVARFRDGQQRVSDDAEGDQSHSLGASREPERILCGRFVTLSGIFTSGCWHEL